MKAAETICHLDLPEGLGKIRREKLTNTIFKEKFIKNFMSAFFVLAKNSEQSTCWPPQSKDNRVS